MIQKELYLTPENRSEKVREWLQQCTAVKGHRPFNLNPAHAALVVLDMQNYFLDPASHAFVSSGPAILPAVNRLIAWAQTNHLPIILTHHVDKPDSESMMVRWWGGCIAENSPDALLDSRVCSSAAAATAPTQVSDVKSEDFYCVQGIAPGILGDANVIKPWLLTKYHYSAFRQTPLDDFLRQRSVSQLIIAGLLTHLCCDTTAREAFMLGYEVFFAADATASYTENLHVGALRSLAHGFAVCMTAEEITGGPIC
jgi:isochorismate hydrolase